VVLESPGIRNTAKVANRREDCQQRKVGSLATFPKEEEYQNLE
jgi:hypothetical protein